MIGMVIVTHGAIGAELLAALTRVVGEQPQAKALSVGDDDDMTAKQSEIVAAVKETNDGSGVILLTDMFGGTPSNLALASMPKTGAVVLAGVNLPVLIKLASVRETMGLLEAAREAEMAGRKYIQLITENLAPNAV
jgi:PTS system mannose-specific IIA component